MKRFRTATAAVALLGATVLAVPSIVGPDARADDRVGVVAACNPTAWDASRVYTGGNDVSHKGRNWQAKWWTQGEEPGTTGEWGVWKDLGACGGGGTTPPPPTAAPPGTTPPPTTSTTPPSNPGAGGKVIGYFAQWGVYGKNYHVKNIDTSGSAAQLTHILYAFGNVQGGKCTIGDSYADHDRAYSAAESVDGKPTPGTPASCGARSTSSASSRPSTPT
jgi:chitinase